MFRQIIVFTRDSKLPTCQALKAEAQKKGLSCQFFNPFNDAPNKLLDSNIDESTLILPRTSGVLFDDWDLTLLNQCLDLGANSSHLPSSIAKLRDKDRQYLFLKKLKLDCVETLIHRGQLTEENLKAFSDSSRWVVKSNRGNKGIGHQLLVTDELIQWWAKKVSDHDQRYIIQPFFAVEEHRLLVLGEDSFLFKKTPLDSSSWKKNASSSDFVEISPNKEKLATLDSIQDSLSEALNLKSYAVDLFLIDGEYKILEVNANPGMEAASKGLKQEINLYQKFLSCFV